MAKITREQYAKWTAQANAFGAGWVFDLKTFVIWGEKEVKKTVDNGDGTYDEYKILWRDEYETITNEYGCRYNKRTGRYIPTLVYNVLKPTTTEGVYRVIPRDEVTFGEPAEKKNYKALCALIQKFETQYIKIEEA